MATHTHDDDAAPTPVAENIAPAPAVFTASAQVEEFVAPAPLIENVAPAPVGTLLQPPVPVVQVVQGPHGQIIEKTVETLVFQFAQGLGTALLCRMKSTETKWWRLDHLFLPNLLLLL